MGRLVNLDTFNSSIGVHLWFHLLARSNQG